jgi:hypothetical protein
MFSDFSVLDQNPIKGQTRYTSSQGQNLEDQLTTLIQTTFLKSQKTSNSFMKPNNSLRGLKYPKLVVL